MNLENEPSVATCHLALALKGAESNLSKAQVPMHFIQFYSIFWVGGRVGGVAVRGVNSSNQVVRHKGVAMGPGGLA